MFDKKTSLAQSGIFEDYVDIHSHMLCGVDDGATTARESEGMIKRFKELGLKKCVLTPHIMQNRYNNQTADLSAQFNKYIAPLALKYDIELALGAEYMIDEALKKRYADGKKLLTIAPNTVLTEITMSMERMGWENEIYNLNLAGYDVILAHPERYPYMREERLRELKNRGTRLQLNFLSLQGWYGRSSMERGKELLKAGIYDHIASDVHYLSMIEDIENTVLDSKTIAALKILAENNKYLK
ncbi:MAG: CpsB/CapC family capsule biosynthesis tyrosine phosphatase [Rikenellaceae bacterium]